MKPLSQNLGDQSARIAVSAEVWEGINAVRQSGLTNMLDRPVVARLANELGYPEAARWVAENPKKFSDGLFNGFVVEHQGL